MPKTLVIVESPAKAKTISKYLPKGYKVQASMGHVRDLPKSKLGIDIEHNFEPSYVTIRGKGDILKKIKSDANGADNILLATDPDREGEAISWHIAQYLKLNEIDMCRIEFHEITKTAIRNAIHNKRNIDMNLVDSQQARRVLDRIVGYSISPLLWKKVRKGLSAGRVQSVSTKIIVDREKEIMDFVSEEYWLLSLLLSKDRNEFEAKFYGIDGKKVELTDENMVNDIIDHIEKNDLVVSNIKESKKNRRPPNPFTTSTLQQEAFKKLNFSTKKTMSLAQQLYEGMNISGYGHVGLITYMRTDSIRISDEAKGQCGKYISDHYGQEYIGNNKGKQTGKNIQDAHEAIRPTSMELEPERVKESLKRDHYRLYKLIWNRFMASQMSNAIYDTMSVSIDSLPYNFRATGSTLIFKGFLKVYNSPQEGEEEDKNMIPKLNTDEKVKLVKSQKDQKFTSPPSRFTEASLVKILEEKGIGRPSTYSPTIQTILNRGYVEVEDKKFFPTELGFKVTELMEEYFDDIVDISFTADMEDSLDKVADGKTYWKNIISDFYEDFSTKLNHAEKVMEKIKIEDPVSDVACDKCGRLMVIKTGRYGKFLACPGFPDCRNAKPYLEEVGVNCPKCDGVIVARKTKKGRSFYGCSNYPDCDFVSWDKPLPEKCPQCGDMLLQKGYGKKSKIYCSNENCDYKRNS